VQSITKVDLNGNFTRTITEFYISNHGPTRGKMRNYKYQKRKQLSIYKEGHNTQYKQNYNNNKQYILLMFI